MSGQKENQRVRMPRRNVNSRGKGASKKPVFPRRHSPPEAGIPKEKVRSVSGKERTLLRRGKKHHFAMVRKGRCLFEAAAGWR